MHMRPLDAAALQTVSRLSAARKADMGDGGIHSASPDTLPSDRMAGCVVSSSKHMQTVSSCSGHGTACMRVWQ
jgi:hypothetical protein